MSKRNILICADGTGNQYGSNNTNVIKLIALAEKSERQLVFYDEGIGTESIRKADCYSKQCKKYLKNLYRQATGMGMEKNMEDAYRFLMQNYQGEDDHLYLLGFSRGAYTVRSLAGMLHTMGLLHSGLYNMVEDASKIYRTQRNTREIDRFKKNFSRPCPVYFIGVWDTVAALRSSEKRDFHDFRLNPEVRFAFHALSVDEKRGPFKPALWDEEHKASGQTLEQVWFPGVHSDVGGWYGEPGLSNIALNWMARKAISYGLHLNQDQLEERRGNPHGQLHDSFTCIWYLTFSRRVLGGRLRIPCKVPRHIPQNAKLHRSVLERKDNPKNNYKPSNLPTDFQIVE